MKTMLSVLIAISAIIGLGSMNVQSVQAASATSPRITVCSKTTPYNGCVIDRSTSVNIPASGEYSVVGNIGRGTHDSSCQAEEDFDLYIDGRYFGSSFDNNPCESGNSDVYTNQNFSNITLSAGNHTVRMIHRLWNRAVVASPESVSVSLTFTTLAPPPTPINGVCGSSNGSVFDTVPTSGFCAVGNASAINGSGPWNWTCSGSNGGSTASCNADITPAPECGPSDGQTFSAMPTNGFCAVGNASDVNGDGPWNWTCTSGVRETNCSAQYAQTAIQIIKTNGINGGDSQTIESGQDASFVITVNNTGEETLENVVITDSEANQCGRSASQTQDLYEGDLFDVGESFSYNCIDTGVTATYTNIANVSAEAITSDVVVTAQDDSDVVVSDPESPEEPDQPDTPTPEPEDEDEDDDGAIGNFVWHDRNGDGVQDEGEEGIVGVKLKLYNGNDVETDKTNSQGRYKFKDLDPGQYKVVVAQETLPEGCYQTYDKDGKLDGQIKTRIEGDEYYRKADFGYKCPSKVVHQTSPQTGAGATAGVVSMIIAGLSSGYVYRRNSRINS